MIDLETAHARYDALRERDRTIASMQSKRRMRPIFEHLLDDEAREALDAQLRDALGEVRRDARSLAVDLARRALLDQGIDDLGRLRPALARVEAFLDDTPGEALDVCFDLLTFIESRAEVTGSGPPRRPPPDDDA